jgi:hypothetical protein
MFPDIYVSTLLILIRLQNWSIVRQYCCKRKLTVICHFLIRHGQMQKSDVTIVRR